MNAIAQARLYLEKLPKGAVEGDIELHEAIAHLTAVLTQLDEVKPTAYVSAAAIDRLKHEPDLAGVGVAMNRQPGAGLVEVYTAPAMQVLLDMGIDNQPPLILTESPPCAHHAPLAETKIGGTL